MDVTATILYEMGLPVPADMDGRVITEAYAAHRIEADPPRRSDVDTRTAPDERTIFSKDEEARVAERLKQLGYLE